ncbi:PAS domain-containing sensor histidine kinase [Massilia sp. YIM B02763]|uniref:sensor histidine kinase n=1 Tax=Massilia sp. YIM B02763 TaxID=3050130 RepID=UPI0025B71C78|nr:PAS domain-containing sensor histidine kinase [Massilia sp. YIM B02763]MDN4054775.1 PAS domain-containing sensor histidine kinase [Massilia sp. YIM B02763]
MTPNAPPASLSQRFALAAAILTAAAVLLIAGVSFWLIDHQRIQANALLQQREVAFHATTVGRNLEVLTTRVAEVANSPILATALVDSAGKETYLTPFLHGLRQMNGIPLQLLFTDFEGKEIASNGVPGFTEADLAWLRARIESGDERPALQSGPKGDELIAVNLLRYSRTRTPEGALMVKIRLADLKPVQWASFARTDARADVARRGAPDVHEIAAAVPLPKHLAHLGLQLREDERHLAAPLDAAAPQYLLIVGVAAVLALVVFLLASRLALGLTQDLRRLQAFSASLGDEGISSQRAPLEGSLEVVGLAGALNRMLDRLYEQHVHLEAERQKFLQLSNNIPQLVWIADPQGNIMWFNERWYEFTGVAPGTMDPNDWHAFHDPDQLPQVRRRWEAALASGEMAQMTFPLRGADGRYRNFFTSVAPLRDAGGAIVQWFGTCTDVTPLERAERAVRYSEERLQQGLVAARMAVWERDPSSGQVSFSANLHSVFGKSWHNVAELWRLVDADDREQVRELTERALREGGEYRITPRIRRADDGNTAWIDIRGRLGLGPDGRSTVMHAVAIDITERKRAEEALRLADRRKDEFLAMLAHELRNPLAPIASAADMLRLAYADEPRVKQISDIVARQVAHMRHLVDDLLDVSRVTRGLVTVNRKPIDLRTAVGEAIEQSRPLIDARRHQLQVRMAQQPLMVDGDHTRLVQVAANLINNAAKYTPEGGLIEVALDAVDGRAQLMVRDNGSGIGQDLLPVVFDLFTQGSRTLDRTQGGLGLGLALVRKLVELHGGRVDAASPGLGRGSTFTVRLPLLA